jgi:hypothetical protein
MNNMIGVAPASIGLRVSQAPTRGAGVNLVAQRAINRVASQCFNCRVTKYWNQLGLPLNVKTAKSVGVFKRRVAIT